MSDTKHPDQCPECGQWILEPLPWEWALRVHSAEGNYTTAYWRGPDALDQVYREADAHSLDRRQAILMTANGGVSWGVADTRDPGEKWIVGRDRWRENHRQALADGRTVEFR